MTISKPTIRHGIDCIGYTGVSLDDIYRQLKDLRESTNTLIKELNDCKSQVIQNKINIDDTDGIILFIDLSVELFVRFLYECDRLLDEIPNEVKDFHIDMLNEMIELSKFRKNACVDFKREHIIKDLRNESMRPLLDDIYGETRDGFEAYMALGGVSPRLKTYIGTKLIQKSEKQEKPATSKIVPFPTPSDARWNELKISFIDNESVNITIRDKNTKVTYAEMGFKDKRACKPSSSWHFLKELAGNKGRLTDYPKAIKYKVEKKVSVLRGKLAAYFNISDLPISYIKTEDYAGYKTAFEIEDKSY